MNKQYHLVIFDWEGTLADTIGQVLHSLAVEAKKLNFGTFDSRSVREFISAGLTTVMKKAFPHLTMGQQQNLLAAVQQSMLAKQVGVCLIPGAKAIIEQLRQAGVVLAIATNKGQQSLQKALIDSGLEDYFSITRSAGQVPPKPYPQMLEEILSEANLSVTEALMVGDSVSDIEMASRIGMDAVGVDFDYQNTQSLLAAGALAVFDDYKKLAKFLDM